MRLLILTQYYPPEIGAPQNRLHELAVRLKKSGIDVEVLTAMPNYPSMEILPGYEKGKVKEEVIDGIKVYRAKIFVTKSKGVVKRLLNYFSFVFTSYIRGRKLGKYDHILTESPPLFLGYSGMALSRVLRAKLIFNVADLWPESAEKMGIVTNKMLLKFAYKLEAKCYKRATLVTAQTNGQAANIKRRFPDVETYWLPNGVDLSYYNPDEIQPGNFRERNGFSEDQIVIFYGGIIGHAQGLQIILQLADNYRDNQKVQFVLQGSGPEKDMLLEMKASMKLENVHFLPPVTKAEMPAILKVVDIALIPLRKLDLFEDVIPSKVFETLAMEVPMILGVDGEARHHFIEKAQAGLFYEPENLQDMKKQLDFMLDNPLEMKEMGKRGRAYANIHFNRNIIAEKLIERLRSL